ncbi:MAG: phosphodiesterase YaeI [Solibacteraceae bacterium]|nr:phosphodiesterase YaeI [Solibacteraceae bacterium]
MLTRRRWMGVGAAGLALGCGYPVVVEPRWLELTRTRVRLGRRGEAAGVRILHLTDLHASWLVPLSQIEEAFAAGLAENPDVICLTGDFISHRDDFDAAAYAALLRRMTAGRPAFAVLGNHDGGSWAGARRGHPDHRVVGRILEEAGVHLLHNRAMEVEVRGARWTMAGVGDWWSEEVDAERAFRGVQADGRVIVLSHNPDAKEALGGYAWDLMLCGHTHGGQVVIPFVGPHYAPVRDKRFVAGLCDWNGRPIYVSRGVGHFASVRFRCRPEATVLEVEAGGEARTGSWGVVDSLNG